MRLLLTAAGVRNASLRTALADLLGRPFARAGVVVVPTASVAVGGDHGWLIDDLNLLYGLGWRELDIVDLNGLPKRMVAERLAHADVIYAAGGNQYHLARSIIANDLADDMARLLETRVYVGMSAGSMIFSRHLTERTAEALGELDDLDVLGESWAVPPFGLFDWHVKPHLHSPSFPERDDAWLAALGRKVDFPMYVLDDDSAVRVRDGRVDVVSEGEWHLLNG